MAPFIPLSFWQGIVGKFMYFLPVTLIITLLASLLVAYIINPVFAVDFMSKEHPSAESKSDNKKFIKNTRNWAIIIGKLFDFWLWIWEFDVVVLFVVCFASFLAEKSH